MEVKVEVKKEGPEYSLSTSVGLEDLKNEPEDGHPAMEVKVEKEEKFAEDDQKYIDNHLSTSTDLQDLKDESEENQPGEALSQINNKQFRNCGFIMFCQILVCC
ncbi:unnamed protein product [Diabrotica balteata]|uniref:Uncharacterized protein n=1 Tax=Diabrotica balteata TaxID=107213 RepID=A0A9N9X713_DIABA|nr:unnamed protein product [Diabrotica balteata]